MPFIMMPTQTADIHDVESSSSEWPAITSGASQSAIPQFILGTDTCGFTTGSTLTCDVGYECVNVDSYRGCCVAGAPDCSATIYTSCLDFEEMPSAAMCGPQTLCCPFSKAYCATYGFATENPPGATLTHIRCAETPSFDQLYPFPPDLSTTTESLSTETDILTIAPVESIAPSPPLPPPQPPLSSSPPSSSSSSDSVSTGTIAGAVVGGAVFAILAILAVFLLIRRRRKRREGHTRNGSGAGKPEAPSTGEAGYGNSVASPFAVGVQAISPRTPTSPRGKRLSVSSILIRRQSLVENWPFPIGVPMSPRNPLSSHPVRPLEKRHSLDEVSLRPESTNSTEVDVPILEIPSPPLLRTGLAPPPPPPESKSLGASDQSNTKARSGSVVQSPRLSSIPPPALDTANGNDFIKRTSSGGEPGDHVGISIDRGQDEADYIVSPLRPDDDANGHASPMTVSPLESRRGSFGR
ncbi:hypothetical protein F5Y14DRAFT_462252 [Nemania sp. NC0429]|nr:hypothetical protein F5Y14DRAFT_462252 [Nemania sp. NC0429]